MRTDLMISVIASITVRPNRRSEFIKIFKANVPKVKAEQGCIEYLPTVDLKTDLPVQNLEENTVTILEKWQSVEALLMHLQAPHMTAYGEQVKDLVESLSIKILTEA
jgi:quinol monooxygenase YgiN